MYEPYADLGYVSGRRWPLRTHAEALEAWQAFRDTRTARVYTSAQLARIDRRIQRALTETAGDPVAATISGIALVPGVSRNHRLYTKELIGKIAARASERIASGSMPLTMLTHHDAEDDSLRIVGHLTNVYQDDEGKLRFQAAMANTESAKDILDLTNGKHLRNVSIRGGWLGPPRKEYMGADVGQVETGEDFELNGIDFTKSPGVPDAVLDEPGAAKIPESVGTAWPVTESVEFVSITETLEEQMPDEADKTPYGDVTYADPGYQSDVKKRYPVDTKAHAKAAWSYVNQDDNAKLYTADQLGKVKANIVKALKGFGVTVSAKEGFIVEPVTQVTEAFGECWSMDQPAGSFAVNLCNGPLYVTVGSYGIDPNELTRIGCAAMAAACAALLVMDPDDDGDIDVPGAPAADTDHDAADVAASTENTTETTPVEGASTIPSTAVAKEATVSGEKTAAEKTAQAPAPAGGLSKKDLKAIVKMIAKEQAPKKADVAETATVVEPATTETEDQRITRLVAEGIEKERDRITTEAVQAAIASTGGRGITRRGLVREMSTVPDTTDAGAEIGPHGVPSNWPQKPLADYTPQELKKYGGGMLADVIIGPMA